jgi:hypothetical protein
MLTVAGLSLLCACAAAPPPLRLHEPAARLDPEAAIGFFTLGLDLSGDPGVTFVAKSVFVSETRGDETKVHSFDIDSPYDHTNVRNDSLVSFALPPGDYEIEKFVAVHEVFLNPETYKIALHVKIHLEPGQVRYFGHFEVDLAQCSWVPADAERGEPTAERIKERIGQGSLLLSSGHLRCTMEIQDRYGADVGLVDERFGLPESVQVLDGTAPHETRAP